MEDLGQRITRLEERVRFMAATVSGIADRVDELEAERDREHGRAAAIAETAARAASAASSSERRWFAVAGIVLTALNVLADIAIR